MTPSPAPRSALRPDGVSLSVPFAVSVALHVGAVVAALITRGLLRVLTFLMITLFPWCAPDPEPLIADALEVSVVSLPKSRTNLPDKAERRPRPPPRPDKAPVKPDPKPPVKESDLVHRTKTPPPAPKGTPDAQPSREELLAELKRQELLDDILADAPVGTENRVPTAVDGVGDEVVGRSLSGVAGDPQLAAWQTQVADAFNQHFSPLGGRDDLMVRARIRFDSGTGEVLGYEITKSSGVRGWDSAAERALALVRTIPVPPAAHRTDAATRYVDVEFVKQ